MNNLFRFFIVLFLLSNSIVWSQDRVFKIGGVQSCTYNLESGEKDYHDVELNSLKVDYFIDITVVITALVSNGGKDVEGLPGIYYIDDTVVIDYFTHLISGKYGSGTFEMLIDREGKVIEIVLFGEEDGEEDPACFSLHFESE